MNVAAVALSFPVSGRSAGAAACRDLPGYPGVRWVRDDLLLNLGRDRAVAPFRVQDIELQLTVPVDSKHFVPAAGLRAKYAENVRLSDVGLLVEHNPGYQLLVIRQEDEPSVRGLHIGERGTQVTELVTGDPAASRVAVYSILVWYLLRVVLDRVQRFPDYRWRLCADTLVGMRGVGRYRFLSVFTRWVPAAVVMMFGFSEMLQAESMILREFVSHHTWAGRHARRCGISVEEGASPGDLGGSDALRALWDTKSLQLQINAATATMVLTILSVVMSWGH